jgi:UDP-galactopyranose mutase
MPVYFFEEPFFGGEAPPHLARYVVGQNLTILVPHMPTDMPYVLAAPEQKRLFLDFFSANRLREPVLWFYTPAALEFADALPAAVTVYDCMDELSAFQGASPELPGLEADLLNRADVVFTGGMSLYELKRRRHPNVHAFPSAVDVAHFAQARNSLPEPRDQVAIPHPRVGFFGVIDERLDRDLVAGIARLRPDWQFVLVGPVVKIEPHSLPRAKNIHYLGRKSYDELPAYLAGWDAAMMPFARNAATRFISPTKTPEYLAAGKPVVSTPIVDVVRRWGHLEAVRIVAGPAQFVSETAIALTLTGGGPRWLEAVDAELEQLSWDRTWTQMADLTAAALNRNEVAPATARRGSSPDVQELALQSANGEARV